MAPKPEGAPRSRHKRSQSPAPQKRSRRLFAGAIAGILIALGVFGAVAWQRHQYFDANADSGRFVGAQSAADAGADGSPEKPGASAADRPVFRYSVVPGGVRSPEELLEAMARDSVVAEHYAGVDPAKMRTERLREPMQAHVSYRIADRVYWTNKKITLQAGEQILTDDKTTVRGRCGNSVSVDPLLPTLDNEPRPAAFDSIINPVSASREGLDPAMSYLAPPYVTSSPLMPGPGGTVFGGPPPGMPLPGGVTSPGIPPSGGNGPPGTPPGSTPPGGTLPGGPPPGNPPGDPPGVPPPGGDPPGKPPIGPPPEFTPRTFPDPPTPVPEPGTLLLVAAGAAALLARRLRKQSQ